MAIERQGRGAWPSDGRGGTLKNPTAPGKYYMLAPGFAAVGLAAPLRFIAGQPIPLDELAVHKGVLAIQKLLNACPNIQTRVAEDGIFGEKTSIAVKEVQKLGSVKEDGVVGVNTMKTLMLLPIVSREASFGVPWQATFGILQFEGGGDPGAVGYADKADLGLAQVNTHAHPTVTLEQAFDPFWAIEFVDGYLANAMKYLNNNLRDAVASYNLGIGGTRQWIADGRPEKWMPSWSTIERKPNEYVDRILSAK